MVVYRFCKHVFRDQPIRVILMIGLSVVVGVLEGFGVALLVPLLTMMNPNGPASVDSMTGFVVDVFDVFGLSVTIGSLLMTVFLIVVFQQAVFLAQQKVSYGAVYGYEARLRNELYETIFRSSWTFFGRQKAGNLIDALTVEANTATAAFLQLMNFGSILIVVAAYLVAAFLLSWKMTALAVVGLAAITLLLKGRHRISRRLGKQIASANSELQSEAFDVVSAAKLVKSSASENSAISRFSSRSALLARAKYQTQLNKAFLRAMFEPVAAGALCIGIFLAVTVFAMPIEIIITFLFIFYRIAPRVQNSQQMLLDVLSNVAALDRINVLKAEALQEREITGGQVLHEFGQGIVLEGLSFEYEPDRPVLRSIDLHIPKGKTVAIVGPSGAGKSTIADMVMGLLTPIHGRVAVDGVGMKDIDIREWRRRIGYITQEDVIFHASIRENILWVAPNASDENIWDSLQVAYADEFVEALPQGVETVVGDRGVRLSGGQRQRLALARAIARDPWLVILDEATSALDAESEEKIQQAVNRLAEHMTILVITHRLATVQGADHIYFLENGTIVEHGSWKTLVEMDGRFCKMMELQRLTGEED